MAETRLTVDTITSDQLDNLQDELAALKTIARGYCPECGRGDASPTAENWYAERQRADQAEAAIERVRDICARMRSGTARNWADRIEDALDEPKEQRACRRCGCPAGSTDCSHCNCCDVPEQPKDQP